MRDAADVVLVHANGEPAILLLKSDYTLLLVPEFDGTLLRRIELISAPEKLAAVRAVIDDADPAAARQR